VSNRSKTDCHLVGAGEQHRQQFESAMGRVAACSDRDWHRVLSPPASRRARGCPCSLYAL